MADEYVDARISDLTAADSISDDDLFVLEQSGVAKKLGGLYLRNLATNAGSAAGAAAGQAFVQAAEDAADDAQDAAGAAVRAARNAQDILLDVEYEGDIAIVNIKDAADDSLADIAAANTSALSNISSAKTNAIADIASEKTEAIAEIDGAVEEVESYAYDIEGLKDLQNEKTVTGTQITVEDAAPLNAKKVLLTLKPHQDLHGQSAPYPAGGGKNKLPVTIENLKTINTSGTWNGNAYTVSDVTFNVSVDGGGNVQSISTSGTATADISFLLANKTTMPLDAADTITNGCPSGGSSSTYCIGISRSGYSWVQDTGSGVTASFTTSMSSYSIYIYIANGTSAANKTFTPMLRLSTESDPTFAPYSNICPIEGYTGVEVIRTGENLFNTSAVTDGYINTDGIVIQFQGVWASDFIPIKNNTSYTLSYNRTVTSTITGMRIAWYDANKTFIRRDGILEETTLGYKSTEATSPSNAVYARVSLANTNTGNEQEFREALSVVANICINQWDEVMESGSITTTGVKYDSPTNIRSTNYIPVKAGENYSFVSPNGCFACYYDKDKIYVSNIFIPSGAATITIPDNAFYMLFRTPDTYGTTYKNDISINYPASFTDYYPYTGRDVAYSGYIDVGKGILTATRKNVKASNLAWTAYANGYGAAITDGKHDTIICSHYKAVTTDGTWDVLQDGEIRFKSTAVRIKDTAHQTDISAWNNYLAAQNTAGTPVIISYELATPVTIQLTPQQLQMLKGLNNIQTDADDMELAYCYVKDGKSVVVGNAEQLLSKEMTNDQEPYLFRASGGNGADREYDTLVGGTVAWNQLANTANIADSTGEVTKTNNHNGSITFSGTASSTYLTSLAQHPGITKTHVYCFLFNGTMDSFIYFGGSNTYKNVGDCLWKATFNETGNLIAQIKNGLSYNVTLFPQIHDLTQDFGSTIADYVYSLEQATAGSGIAWLKKYGFFTKPYYPYNAGELMSVKTTRHKMVGFNWFDEEWPTKTTTYMRGTKIKVFPNTRYYGSYFGIKGTSIQVYWAEYNDSGSLISPNSVSALTSEGNAFRSFVTKPNVAYIIPQINFSGTAPSGFKSCLGLYNTAKNGTYEPYTTYEYPLDPKVTLQGIYKLNGDKLYCDGDKYYPDKGVERRYKLVDLGTLDWTYETASSVSPYFFANLPQDAKYYGTFYTAIYPCLCTKYVTTKRNATDFVDKTCCIDGTTGRAYAFEIKDLSYTDAATFKTAVSGQYLVYEIATPYFETADPFEQLQALDPYGTEEYIDDREVPIPVGHDTNYPVNLRAEIERVMKEVPPPPTSNGTYILKVTVASGVPTYSWVAQ